MIVVNIEAYDAESLRKLVRLLEYENKLLKDKLKKENIPYDEVSPFEETIDHVEEKMFMPSVVKTEVIFHNAIIVGMTGFVQNNEAKRCFAMSVKIQNGQD